MKDKIIQITDTIDSEAEGQTLGLSESGKLYILTYKAVPVEGEVEEPFKGKRHVYVPDCWKLLVDSPEIKPNYK